MISESSNISLPLRITLKAVLNIALVWVMATYLDQFFQLSGSWRAIIIVGALITLLNIFIRPVLEVITLPLKLFATLIAFIIVNGGIVQLTQMVTQRMDPADVQLEIFGGLWGWLVVATVFGFGNWLIRTILKPRGE
jgi:uncharacterized membrane protein YvlD (DUF360 family)